MWTAIAAGMTLAALAGAGPALAAPTLTIVQPNGIHPEVTGDPGGTNHAAPAGSPNGPGLPSANGGWPAGPGFAPDPTFGNVLGTSGFHGAYLNLDQAADVTFQYMGSGDASLPNTFGLDTNANGILDAAEVLFRSGVTGACSMQGGVVPLCQAGVNEFTVSLGAGRIAFLFETGLGVTLDNTGANLGNPDTLGQNPGYFLGVDPYLAAGQFTTSGRAVYAGLTDRPAPGDHDFQDLGVRISVVPEPGSLALAGIAALGLMATSRRRKAAPELGLPPPAALAA